MQTEFINRLNRVQGNHIPVWLMRQAGRYLPEYKEVRAKAGDFLNLCYTPELASEVTLQPLRRYDLDAAIIFSDILVVPHALGQAVRFVAGEGPQLDPVTDIKELNEWDEQKFLTFLNPVFDALSLTRQELPNDKALIGFAGAPWTLACYMINGGGSRDYYNVRLFARQNPKQFQALLDLLVTAISSYLIKKIDSGADAVQIFDSWAGVLSAEEFNDYCILPTKRIVTAIQTQKPHISVIGFPRGVGHNYQKYIDETGINCVSCDQSVPLDVMAGFQEQVCVQGNLDNLLLRQGGEAMIAQAEKICMTLKNKPFVFNLGHGVIKETDPGNVNLLIETIRKMQDL